MIDPAPFLEYVRLRLAASARRAEGGPPPWSDDPIIASKHFCNVIRDDDRTSRGARRYIEEQLLDVGWPAAMTFRLYNRPDTLAALLESRAFNQGTTGAEIEMTLRALPMVFNTVAYRVTLKGGLWNLPTLAQMVYRAGRLARSCWRPRATAEHACQQLQGELGIGPFLAYQVMQDLRWLCGPFEDEDRWCLVGGGAQKGIDHLRGEYERPKMDPKNRMDHNVSGSMTKADLETWAPLLIALKSVEPRANMFELEHNLCASTGSGRASAGARRRGGRGDQRPNLRRPRRGRLLIFNQGVTL